MKGKKKRLHAGICFCLMAGIMVLGGAWWTFVKGTEENMVDLSKGITHEYASETDTTGFINLNGNSVIIEESVNSTDTNRLCNIYIDTNRNGKIDSGEEKASLTGSGEDIDATLPIYGIYRQGSAVPISITIQSGHYPTIYGLNGGAILTEEAGEAACTINVQGGDITTLCALVGARIDTSAATAVDMNVTGGTIGNCTGVQGGQITTAATAVNMNVTGGTIGNCTGTQGAQITTVSGEQKAVVITVNNGMIQGACNGIQGGRIITSDNAQTALYMTVTGAADVKGAVYGIQGSGQVKGSVDLNIQPDNNISFGAVYGITNGVFVEGSVSAILDNVTVGGLELVYGSSSNNNRIEGNVSLTTGSNTEVSSYYLVSYSSVGGDVTADLYGNMQEGATSGASCYGVQNGSVEGKVDITLRDGLFQNVVGTQNASVKGDVDVSYLKGTYTANCWGVWQAAVGGDVTITSSEAAEFTYNFTGCYSTTIGGSVHLDIYNKNTNQNKNNIFIGVNNGTGNNSITGEVDIKLQGGYWDRASGILSASSNQFLSDCRVEFNNVDYGYKLIGIENGEMTCNATVIFTKCNTLKSCTDLYGINLSTITGDADVAITDCNVIGANIFGISEATVTGDTHINMTGAEITSGSNRIYGASGLTADGEVTINMESCKGHALYGMANNCVIAGDAAVTITTCEINTDEYEKICGMANVNCQKGVTLNCSGNKTGCFTGIDYCNISGDVVLTTNGDVTKYSGTDDNYVAIQYGTIGGDVTITTKDCKYGNYSGVNGTQCNGNIQITMDGGSYAGSQIIPYSSLNASHSGEEKQLITVSCQNVAFTFTDSYASVFNRLTDGYQLTMTMDDSCTVGDNYKPSANISAGGDALLICKGDYYYTGNYPITEDITANNIFFGKDDTSSISANLLIPEGVTMTAAGNIYLANEADVLIEGSLKGAIYESADGNNYCNGTVYMNGGVFEDNSKVRRLYYPLTFSYSKKSGSIAPAESKSNIGTNSLRPELYFGFVGAEITVTCEAKKGYTLDEVTVTKGEGAKEVLTASIGTNYCFDMDTCPAEITASFSGTPITLGKEEDSLATKLYEKTTKAAPLYDLTDIAITNDAEEGDVTYEVKEGSSLPKGLILEEGKLFGAPTQAFEDGMDAVIQVTGCNGTTAQFTLHITVMAGDEEGNPAYAVPEDLTAVYGDTLGDVELPSDENGAFTWQQELSTSVGDAGEHEFLVTYTPTNKKYKTVMDIKVTVTVQKAKVQFSKVEELSAKHEDTLNDLVLPEAENGEYYWIISTTVKPVDGKAYELGFRPLDANNYDWAAIEGWDEQTGSVIMAVTVMIQHNYGTAWEKDEINHWHVCECGAIQEKVPHTWDEGTITKEATEEENGIKKYRCTACEAEKEEVIPAIGHTHVFNEAWEKDEDNHWHVCECGEVQGKAAHVWNAGTVTKEATATEDGIKQYTCTVCGKTKEEAIKATGDTGNDPSQGSTGVNPVQQGTTETPNLTGKQAASKGTILTDSATKAKYKVISSENEEPAVQYVSSTDTSASIVTIASSVTIDGVDYKITEIADNAFKNNKKLKKITIAGNIVTIGKSAFEGCTALTTVKLGSSVKTIKDKAFYGCKKLSSLTLGANVVTLGKSAFEGCISLKKVTIPKKVTKIGSKAFYNCKKLVNITIKTTKLTTKKVGSKAFTKAGSSNYKKLKVKVPKSKLKPYKTMLKKKGLSAKAKIKK